MWTFLFPILVKQNQKDLKQIITLGVIVYLNINIFLYKCIQFNDSLQQEKGTKLTAGEELQFLSRQVVIEALQSSATTSEPLRDNGGTVLK